jgi:SAM-dependent methyltransferase
MGLSEFITHQLARPRGRFAGLTARFLNRANRGMSSDAVNILDPAVNHHVMDLGFGGGVALEELLGRPGILVTAIDPSAEMVSRARRRFREHVSSARLTVKEGTAASLPLTDACLDGVITVNTIYFWPDVLAGLTEIRRVLRPGGVLVVGMSPRAKSFEGREVDGRRLDPPSVEKVVAQMTEAEFEDVAVTEHAGGNMMLRGRRPG